LGRKKEWKEKNHFRRFKKWPYSVLSGLRTDVKRENTLSFQYLKKEKTLSLGGKRSGKPWFLNISSRKKKERGEHR